MINKIKLLIVLFVISFLSLTLSSSSLDFYKNLAEEGKKLYLAGKYEEAIENFRIAEFGLIESKDLIEEVYLYYSLANFKLSNGDAVFEIIEKLKTLTGIKRFEELKAPEEIRPDLDSMFLVLDKTYKKTVKDIPEIKRSSEKPGSFEEREEFLKIYGEAREALNKNDLSAVISGLKRLKKLNKANIRARFLSGILMFRENKYKKAINELLPVNRTGPDELKDESSYYLALSNYFVKNYGQFLAFSRKVKDKNVNGKLSEITKKVLLIRKNGIEGIKSKFFNKKGFKKFVKSFNGDISLASDILREILGIIPVRIRDIYFMAEAVTGFPWIYDQNFILQIADYFMEKDQKEFSIDIIKRSRFFAEESAENIEIFYKLGLIYHNIGSFKKSKKMMLKVYKINKKYKKVNYYLTNRKS